jgi:hypothetical protein
MNSANMGPLGLDDRAVRAPSRCDNEMVYPMNADPNALPRPSIFVFGVALILGPVLMLTSTIAFIVAGDGMNQGVLGGLFGVWAAIIMAIAFVGLLRLLEVNAPRAAAILTVTAIIGFGSGVAINVDVITSSLVGPELDAAIDDALVGTDALAILAFFPGGLLVPITIIATGIMLWRTQTFPKWIGALLALAGVLFIIGAPERIAAIVLASDIALIAALFPIAWTMLTGGRVPSPAPATPA